MNFNLKCGVKGMHCDKIPLYLEGVVTSVTMKGEGESSMFSVT